MPLHITHLEKGYIFTDNDRKFLAKKVGRLARYCSRIQDESSEIRVETIARDTKKEKDSVKVMITLTLPKKTLRAESRRGEALEAVDRCCEKLEGQIELYKEKHASQSGVGRKSGRRK